MTKRMLSLLLALVMTLSLCVPALAADEFAAEAVTDVEEQAPVAPEAPVEPEAEEPAEEPVVDEPAVEEPAVEDAPELASVMEEEAEDLPMLVALGKITKKAHWNLYNEVEKAAKLAEKIAAGDVRLEAFHDTDAVALPVVDKYAEDPEANDPFKDELKDPTSGKTFEEAYAEAQEMLDAINGAPVDYDVTDPAVDAKTNQLKVWTVDGKVTDKADAETMSPDALQKLLYEEAKKTESPALASYVKDNALQAPFKDATTAIISFAEGSVTDVTKDSNWTKAYSADYLALLQKAINAAAAFKATDKYADYKAAVYAILDALVLEKDAAAPGADLATRANAAVKEAEAIEKADEAKYMFPDAIPEALEGVNGILEGTLGTVPFEPGTTRYEAVEAITTLENKLAKKPGAPTIKVEGFSWEKDAAKVTVSLSAENFPGYNGDYENLDGTGYNIAWQVTPADGGKPAWYAGTSDPTYGVDPSDTGVLELVTGADNALGEDNDWAVSETNSRKIVATVDLANIGGNPFKAGDKVTVHIYKKVGDIKPGAEITLGSSATFVVKESAAVTKAPTVAIKSVEYDKDLGGSITEFEDTSKLVGGTYSITWPELDCVYTVTVTTEKNVEINPKTDAQAVRALATIGGKQYPGVAVTTETNEFTVELSKEADAALKAGKVGTVQIQWSKGKGDEAAFEGNEKATADIVVKPITSWSAVASLKKIVAAANALVAADYEVTEEGSGHIQGSSDTAKRDTIIAGIKARASAINKIITDATAGDTWTNRNTLGATAAELVAWCGYIAPVEVSTTKLQLAIAEAKDLIGDENGNVENGDIAEEEGAGIYTFNTVGKLRDLVNKYSVIIDWTLQSEVNSAEAEIRAAINGLEKLTEVDRSGLEAAIEAAEALEAEKDNYTEESWKALEDALAAAKNMLARENATQTQLTNAAEFLNKAVNGLEKTEEIKKAEAEAALEKALADAEAALADADLYTEESVKALQDVVDAAKALPEDATSKDIQDAADAIEEAIAALEEKPVEPEVDKTQLEGTIAEAEAKVEADYTAESWAAMAEALEAAKTVAADETATQEDVDAAAKALADAMDALVEAGDEPVEPADKSELIAGIAVITALSEYKDEFTAESWAAVEAALEAAQAVLDDENATQEEVDAAVEAMVAALEALEEVPAVIPPAPSSGTGWVENEDGDIYFYQNGQVKESFWVGKADGASKWDGNWYYVGSDGKLVTGMAYLDDLHGGYGWYFLQPTNANGEIGKMLTGWQWVGGEYGTCYFSSKAGESGKCTYSTELGDWTGTTWAK